MHSSHLPRALLIEDDNQCAALIAETLAGEFDLRISPTAAEGLAAYRELATEIVLLDIALPDKDGYAVCGELKSAATGQSPYVICVSGRGDVTARLAAYDAGADDFVAKPFSPEELRHKLRRAAHYLNDYSSVRQQAEEAGKVAYTALTAAGELGVVLRFLQESVQHNEIKDLAGALVSACRDYGLRAVARLSLGDAVVCVNENGASNPLEQSLIEGLLGQKRLVDYGSRTVVNYPHVCLWLRNMPIEDADRCGRLRDHVCMLAEGAERRLQSLEDAQRLACANLTLAQAAEGIAQGLQNLDRYHRHQQSELLTAVQSLVDRIHALLPHLGLTDNQERLLLDAVEDGRRQMLNLYDKSFHIDAQFERIVSLLQSVSTGSQRP